MLLVSNYLNLILQINIIRITEQLAYFRQYQQRVSALIGEDGAQKLVNQALVLITLGGNDFVNNYYLVPLSARSRQYALPDYVVFLISEYRKILMVHSHPSTSLYYHQSYIFFRKFINMNLISTIIYFFLAKNLNVV